MNEALVEEKGTREQLLQVSAELFQQKGYRTTSMRDISLALRIKTSSIYYYINSKEDLLREISVKTMSMLIKAGEKVAFSPSPPEEKLRQLAISHVRLLCKNLHLFTVTLRELAPTNAGSFWGKIVDMRDRYETLVRGIIKSGKESGAFKNVDDKMAGFALLGMLNWIIRWYSPSGEKSPEDIAQLWVDIFLNGIESREKQE